MQLVQIESPMKPMEQLRRFRRESADAWEIAMLDSDASRSYKAREEDYRASLDAWDQGLFQVTCGEIGKAQECIEIARRIARDCRGNDDIERRALDLLASIPEWIEL